MAQDQLKVVALIRSRQEPTDDAFLDLVADMDREELLNVLSCSVTFAGLLIQEMQEKLSAVTSAPSPVTLEEYLNDMEMTIVTVEAEGAVS